MSEILVLSCILWMISFLIFISCVLKVDLFDSFSIYLNATRFVIKSIPFYDPWRPPFIPMLFTPFFWLDQWLANPWGGIILSRVTSVLFWAALLWMSWKFFLLHLSRVEALLAVALCSMNRLLIHFAPFTKEDIPGCFFTVSGFYCYFKAVQTNRTRYWLLAAAAITSAISSRFNLAPPIFLTLFLYEILSRSTRITLTSKKIAFHCPYFLKKTFSICVIPSIFFFLIPAVIYSLVGLAPPEQALHRFLTERAQHFALLKGVMTPISKSIDLNAAFLLKALTVPVALLTLWGGVQSFLHKRQGSGFYFLWFSIFLGVQIFMIRHTESRYQFPFYIPCYYFAAIGFFSILKNIPGKNKRLRQSAAILVSCLILFSPLKEAAAELGRFSDPFYKTDFMGKIGRFAGQLAGSHNILWVGKMYPTYPKDRVFHPADDSSYAYVLYNHTIIFSTHKQIPIYENASLAIPDNGRHGIFIFNAKTIAKDGDVLIINPLPSEKGNDNSSVKNIPPLFVQRIRILQFYPIPSPPSSQSAFFANPDRPDEKIEISHHGQTTFFQGTKLPNGYFELSADIAGQKDPSPINILHIENNQFSFSQKSSKRDITSLSLVYYDSVTPFSSPSPS